MDVCFCVKICFGRKGVASFRLGVLLLVFAITVEPVCAGRIVSVTSPVTGGVTNGPDQQPTLHPNNDDINSIGSSNVNFVSWTIHFNSNLDPLDVIVHTADTSGGTTEYVIITSFQRPPGSVAIELTAFRVQIVADTIPIGLNFDTEGDEIGHLRLFDGQNVNPIVTDTLIEWPHVMFDTGGSLIFENDIPDLSGTGNNTYTLRYIPVVPEPSTVWFILAAIGTLTPRRYRHRFSNHS